MSDTTTLDGLLRWRCIGPFRGGRVVTVAASYDDPNVFYFGACAGGVFKTVDAGTYWQCVTDGFLSTSSIGALAVAPSDSNVIYAGTGEATIRIDVSHGDGVYKSTDAGVTWAHIGLADTRHIGKVRVHPTNPDVVYVAALGHAFGKNSERGVFKSVDGGKTWEKTLFINDGVGVVDLTLDANPRILYAAAYETSRSFHDIISGGPGSGIWQSLDGGESWTDLSDRPGLPQGIKGKIGVAASPARSGRVWALIEHQPDGGLYRSDDHGQTWSKVCEDQNLLSRAWYYTHITADPVDSERVYINNLSLYRSDDGGKAFIEIETPHGDNHDIWIDPKNNQRMIQGNDGGANVSLNGGYTFSTITNQGTAQFYHIAVDNKSPYTVYGTQQDNSSVAVPSGVNHPAISWEHCYLAGSGESGYIVVDPKDDDIVYVGAIGSSPGGNNALQRYDRKRDQIRLITTWPETLRGRGGESHTYRFAWTYPISFSPHDPNVLYATGNFVFKTTDEGQTWEIISPDLTRADPETMKPTGGPVNKDAVGAEIYATIFSFAESPVTPGLLWAGSDDGLVHISRDGGKHWDNITPSTMPEWSMITAIELHPTNADVAYVAATRYKRDDYAPYLYVTRDGGKSWRRIDDGIQRDHFTRVIRIDPTTPGLLYAGTECGLYVSMNDGASWSRFQLNLPVTPIHDLIVKDGDLVAGTHGRSVWILDDLTPLREIVRGNGTAGTHLFPPRDSVRVLPGIDWSAVNPNTTNYLTSRGSGYVGSTDENGLTTRTYLDAGENAPRGAIITYRLAETPAEPLTLTIADASGTVLRTVSSRKADDGAKAKELRGPARAGWNRFVWDLKVDSATKIQGSDPLANAVVPGPFVAPGTYTVTLTVGGQTFSQPLTVLKPASIDTPQADLDAQFAALMDIHGEINTTVAAINRMRDTRAQLEGWEKRAAANADIVAAARALREKVLAIEESLAVPGLRDGWADGINKGARLLEQLPNVASVIALGDYKPTDNALASFERTREKIAAQRQAFDDLLAGEGKAFSAAVAAAGFGAIV